MTAQNLTLFSNVLFTTPTYYGPHTGFFVSGIASPLVPVVSNPSPAPGAVNATATLGFDITVADNSGFSWIMVWVKYQTAHFAEVVYDGGAFADDFSGTITPITNGYQFRFNKPAGFSANPIVYIRAASANGGVM